MWFVPNLLMISLMCLGVSVFYFQYSLNLIPLLRLRVGQSHDPSIVNQNIKPIRLREELVCGLLDRGKGGEVHLQEGDVALRYALLDLRDGGLGLGGRACCEEDLLGRLLRQLQDCFLAEAGVACIAVSRGRRQQSLAIWRTSCDKYHLACQGRHTSLRRPVLSKKPGEHRVEVVGLDVGGVELTEYGVMISRGM